MTIPASEECSSGRGYILKGFEAGVVIHF